MGVENPWHSFKKARIFHFRNKIRAFFLEKYAYYSTKICKYHYTPEKCALFSILKFVFEFVSFLPWLLPKPWAIAEAVELERDTHARAHTYVRKVQLSRKQRDSKDLFSLDMNENQIEIEYKYQSWHCRDQ